MEDDITMSENELVLNRLQLLTCTSCAKTMKYDEYLTCTVCNKDFCIDCIDDLLYSVIKGGGWDKESQLYDRIIEEVPNFSCNVCYPCLTKIEIKILNKLVPNDLPLWVNTNFFTKGGKDHYQTLISTLKGI